MATAEPVCEPRTLWVGHPDDSFSTVQAALDAASPGDTVIIRGGIYREHLVTHRDGEPGRPITIQAAPNQEVLLMPGLPLAGKPEPVKDLPNVFRWPNAGLREASETNLVAFWEAPTHLRLKRVDTREACEHRLASWYYDADSDDLYIRSSGIATADTLIYMREEAKHAVLAVRHAHIHVENLILAFGAFGVHIDGKANAVTVRGCRAYCNRSAGIYVRGDRHVIADNVVFHNNQYGIQLRHGVNYVHVRNNLAYFNGPNNGELTDTSVPADISLYSVGVYNIFEGNVIDGLHQNAFRNKYGGNNANLFRRNVVKGFFDCGARHIVNNTLIVNGLGPRFGGYVNRVTPDANPDPERVDPGGHQRRSNIIYPAVHQETPMFADPVWRDYRLQAGSPYAGMGAYPGAAPVLYVDPVAGDDANHGQAEDAALKTLERALAVVHPGYTIYLKPGLYPQPLRLTIGGLSPEEPLRIRSFGQSTDVIITGGLRVERRGGPDDEVAFADQPFEKIGPRHVVLEGLTFQDQNVRLRDAADIRFSHCVWDVSVDAALDLKTCEAVRIDHATFAGKTTGLVARQSSAVTVSRSLFTNVGVAIDSDTNTTASLQAYFNAYALPSWRAGEQTLTDLSAWQQAVDGSQGEQMHSVKLQADYALPMGSPLTYAADDFSFIGARSAPSAERIVIRDLRVAGLAPRAATIIWETPRGSTESIVVLRGPDGTTQEFKPVSTFQIWGKYFDMAFRTEAFFEADRHFALSDLLPGAAYEVEVTAISADGTAQNQATLQFQTPVEPAPARMFYVSPTGSDAADGKTPERAWRTLRRATAVAGPGDRVRVLPGHYRETLRPRIGGTAEAPIVFESVEPRQAVLDLMESLPAAAEVLNVNHVHLQEFAIANGKYMCGHTFVIANSRGIHVIGCEVRYPRKSSFEKLRLAHAGLVAADAPDLRIEDNVFMCGAYGVGLGRCPGARVIHNTILGEGNYGVAIVPDRPDEVYTVKNNVFERPVMGHKTGSVIWMFNVRAQLDSDYNLFHIPASFNGTIGMMVEDTYKTLPEWQEATDLDRHSIFDKPVFVAPEAGDFRLRAGSPGKNAAEGGNSIGIRR